MAAGSIRAARVVAYGPPEDVAMRQLADPVAGRARRRSTSTTRAVNFPDVLIVANEYQVSIPLPFVPGSEFAGVVADVGDGVTHVQPGDRVYG